MPGLVSNEQKESPLNSLKKSVATPVKPHEGAVTFHKGNSFFFFFILQLKLSLVCFCCHWTEISSRSDVKVEGDKRLDKLESFLDKLHNKGTTRVVFTY